MAEPTTITCLNGRFTRAHRAAVPLADRGFRFGDGVFETIRIEGGVPYQWESHMERLAQGLAALSIRCDVDWADLAHRTLARNKARHGFLRIAISRGVGSKGYLPHPPGMPATYAIEYLPPLPAPDKPARLWLSSWAKIPPSCLPGKFKLAQGANSTLALLEAQEHRCDEALQLTPDGMLAEAASANLFWLADGQFYTPSLDSGCLAGTTREAVLRLAHLPVRSGMYGLATLEKADAVFLTNSRAGIWPVIRLEPAGWDFQTEHRDLRVLAAALELDRKNQQKRDATRWSAE